MNWIASGLGCLWLAETRPRIFEQKWDEIFRKHFKRKQSNDARSILLASFFLFALWVPKFPVSIKHSFFFFFLLSGQNYCREFPTRSITAPRNGSGLHALSSSVGVSEVGKFQYGRSQANLSKFGVYSLNNARGKVTKF